MSKRAIFLDRDAALLDTAVNPADPRSMTLCNGAGAALRLLARLDFCFVVLSQQDGIAHGQLDESALRVLQHRLADLLFREQLVLEGDYYCPHDPDGTVPKYALACLCRKPMPGLLLRAANEHHIDLHESWMIGDLLHDVEAGTRAGCRTVLIDRGKETEWRLGTHRLPTCVVTDIYAAAVVILAAEGEYR
ncbi:MAG: D-glycero-alpha-D-manno-heptose-1,7-bisphosphate 7-phosphatase [Massilia sp.]